MGSITRYIVRQLVVVLVFLTLALTMAVWLSQSLRFIDFIVNRGLPATDFVAFVALLLPQFLGLVLPIAAFCAVLFVYNKLLGESELVVLRAAGLSQLQLARPALIVAVGTMIVVYVIMIWLLPASFRAFKDLQYNLRHDYSSVLLQEGTFNVLTDGITVYIRERGPEGALRGILIHDTREAREPVTMMAEEGALVETDAGPRVVLASGNRQEVDSETGRLSILYFDRYTVDVSDIQEAPGARWRQPKERYMGELFGPPENATDEANLRELRAEGHRRLAHPLYTLAMVAVGLAAMLAGEFNRRGQAKRIFIAVICVGLLQASQLGLVDIAMRNAALTFLVYAAPLATVLLAYLAMVHQPRARRRDAANGAALHGGQAA